jgi:dTDP-N-acetylfucosamine:lipid II N-acetylfucosaminyltransferase
MSKIVHLGHWDKFLPPFIDFVEEHFDMTQHEFFFFGKLDKYSVQPRSNLHLSKDLNLLNVFTVYPLIKALNNADKIILHGLFNTNIIKLLWLMPWLLKKCYWVMWGADLYDHQNKEKVSSKRFFKHQIIKKIGYLVTYIKGDYSLAQQWYHTQANYQECLMYPSNLYKHSEQSSAKTTQSINILIGNSADKSNNHLETFELLKKHAKNNVKIYVPLSYGGNKNYILTVISEGKKIFGDHFIPLTEILPFQDYLALLAEIDIAILNHKRQQAMGNIISLLSFGKKVYLKNDVTHWNFFQEHGMSVFDINQFNLDLISETEKQKNLTIVKDYFSEQNYIYQLNELFK